MDILEQEGCDSYIERQDCRTEAGHSHHYCEVQRQEVYLQGHGKSDQAVEDFGKACER